MNFCHTTCPVDLLQTFHLLWIYRTACFVQDVVQYRLKQTALGLTRSGESDTQNSAPRISSLHAIVVTRGSACPSTTRVSRHGTLLTGVANSLMASPALVIAAAAAMLLWRVAIAT